jgi:hypothetical protein
VSEPTGDACAREHIAALLGQGRAEDLMEAWSLYGQTWPYLAGIIDHVAEEGSSMTAQEFARSLQEESHK